MLPARFSMAFVRCTIVATGGGMNPHSSSSPIEGDLQVGPSIKRDNMQLGMFASGLFVVNMSLSYKCNSNARATLQNEISRCGLVRFVTSQNALVAVFATPLIRGVSLTSRSYLYL